MHDLSFWSIYFPVLAAFITSTLLFEVINFGLSYWHAKKQLKRYEEMQEKIAKGEVTPEMLGYMMGNPEGMPVGFGGLPTASGAESIGQYL